jgi:hypothetical protein
LLKLEAASRIPAPFGRHLVFKETGLDQEGSPTNISVCYHLFDWHCRSELALHRAPESFPFRFSGGAGLIQGVFVREGVVFAAVGRVVLGEY